MIKQDDHFNRQPRRRAEFIRPPNILKEKVGSGGLGEDILARAQKLLEEHAVDFIPLADLYLASVMRGIEGARNQIHHQTQNSGSATPQETLISAIIYPSMQLKANGGMFHYHLVTRIADRMIQFLEVIEKIDVESLEILSAFHTTIRAVVLARITGDGGQYGQELLDALNEACLRYFDKKPYRHKDVDFDYIHKIEEQQE